MKRIKKGENQQKEKKKKKKRQLCWREQKVWPWTSQYVCIYKNIIIILFTELENT